MSLDFDVIAAAGISQREFADIAGVSRVTINKYVRGVGGVGVHVEKKVQRALKIIAAATKLGKLPDGLPPNVRHTSAQRQAALDQIVAQVVEMSQKKKAVSPKT